MSEDKVSPYNGGVSGELPLWKCHKEVRAFKISEILDGEREYTKILKGVEGGVKCRVSVGMFYLNKHRPAVGGYYVLYADGYESYSPGKALEEGYTRIPTAPSSSEVSHAASATRISRVHSDLITAMMTQGPSEIAAALDNMEGAINQARDELGLSGHG